MATSRAPRGGVVSAVNGQFYEGGEFTPDHGLYCGKGRNRCTQAAFDDLARKVEAAGKTLVWDEARGDFRILYQGGNCMFRAANLKTLAKLYP
jgi:hypothetical protein